MKAKNVTFGFGASALTLTIWEDLGVCKVTKSFSSLLGWEVSRNYRLDAMTRCDTTMLAIGPFGITWSKVYERREEDE